MRFYITPDQCLRAKERTSLDLTRSSIASVSMFAKFFWVSGVLCFRMTSFTMWESFTSDLGRRPYKKASEYLRLLVL